MNKTVLFAKDARDKVMEGVKKITDAVRVTMGASGKCVLIGEAIYYDGFIKQLPTIVTKDGFTVTKHFDLSDPVENRGALMIKEAAFKTVEMAGDATTCTCVLAEAIISEGMKLVNAGGNSQEIKKGIDAGVEKAVVELKKMSNLIGTDNNKIYNVACVSANNDTAIGRLIADAFKKIGNEGVIDIEAGNGLTTEIKIADGYQWEQGWVSPLFITNKEKQVCEFLNPLILIYQNQVIHHTQVERALRISLDSSRPLLIICENAIEEGLAYLAMNNFQKNVRVCVVKAPYFGEARREAMEDIALLTGGSYISDIRGTSVREIEFDNFGKAKKVVVTKDEAIIVEGDGKSEDIETLINELRMNLTQAKTEDEKSYIEKRIAKLKGGVAVIQVGAATETEMKEKLDRFDDSVRSTKSAIAEGFVAGGGTAYVRITQKYAGITDDSTDFGKGEKLLYNALTVPLRQMAANAGKDPQLVFDSVYDEEGNMGYNTKSEKVEDLVEAGIIDSTKALRCALINAASVSGMLITSECLIESVS